MGVSATANPRRWWVPVVVVACGAAVYAGTLEAPFLFDDLFAIHRNETIRSLGTALTPHGHGGAVSRPIVNFSLALNYALGGLDPRGYHIANLVFHVLAGLALLGVLRRALRAEPAGENLAFGIALLWMVHPLQTESVTCIVQRTELLVGLFYLLTLYCFVRGAEAEKSSFRWLAASVAACALGMASKEVMVSAPLMVLLYDRTFLSGTFAAAWSRRRSFYLALASTWILLAVLVAVTGGHREGSAGFGGGVTAWNYLLTQSEAITLYLKLSVWPHPLVVDYGTGLASGLSDVWPHALAILAFGVASVVALRRAPRVGFLGAWFFALLAPSSSVVPLITQTVAEHRMYLPVAAVVAGVVVVLYRLWPRLAFPLVLAVAALFAGLTVVRNRDYRDEIAIWQDTIEKRPENTRARSNLGQALFAAGRPAEAEAQLAEALRGDPSAETYALLGLALEAQDRMGEAIAAVLRGLALAPGSVEMHTEAGRMMARVGRYDAALPHMAEVVRLDPGSVEGRLRLGSILGLVGRTDAAVAEYREAVRLDPRSARARAELGTLLLDAGRFAAAIPELEEALRLEPGSAEIRALLNEARARR